MVQRWTIEIVQLQFALGGRCPWYASRAGSNPVAALFQCGRLHPVWTWDSPVASNGGRRPCLQVEQVHFSVVAQRQVP